MAFIISMRRLVFCSRTFILRFILIWGLALVWSLSQGIAVLQIDGDVDWLFFALYNDFRMPDNFTGQEIDWILHQELWRINFRTPHVSWYYNRWADRVLYHHVNPICRIKVGTNNRKSYERKCQLDFHMNDWYSYNHIWRLLAVKIGYNRWCNKLQIIVQIGWKIPEWFLWKII